MKIRVEWPEEIASVQIRYALESDQQFHPMTMTPIEGVDRGFEAVVPSLDTLTDQSDNYVFVFIGMNAAGSMIMQSDFMNIAVFSGVPYIDSFEFYSFSTDEYNFIDYPFNDEPITIRAKVIDEVGEIVQVNAYFGLTSWTKLDTMIVLNPDGNDWYEGDLPPMTDLTELADNYIFQIRAIDDTDNEIQSEEIEVVVAPRAPIVYDLENYNYPEVGEGLEIGVNIWDTDGMLTEQYIQYQRDYNSDSYYVALVRDTTYADSTRYIGTIPGQSSGTTVFAQIIAYDEYGNSTWDYPATKR